MGPAWLKPAGAGAALLAEAAAGSSALLRRARGASTPPYAAAAAGRWGAGAAASLWQEARVLLALLLPLSRVGSGREELKRLPLLLLLLLTAGAPTQLKA